MTQTGIKIKDIQDALVAKKEICSGFKNHSFQENFDIGGVFCVDCGFPLDDTWKNQSSEYQRGYRDGYTETAKFSITQQGQVKITLSRENLAKQIFANVSVDEMNYGEIKLYGLEVAWSRLPKWHKDFFLNVSESIIQHLNELLEVEKEGK